MKGSGETTIDIILSQVFFSSCFVKLIRWTFRPKDCDCDGALKVCELSLIKSSARFISYYSTTFGNNLIGL